MDSRVRTTMTTEGEVHVMRGIQDMGAGTKRKEDPSSSNLRKKHKTFCFARISRTGLRLSRPRPGWEI